MSSDYLLSNLGYNPDDSAKRLGDGGQLLQADVHTGFLQVNEGVRIVEGRDVGLIRIAQFTQASFADVVEAAGHEVGTQARRRRRR